MSLTPPAMNFIQKVSTELSQRAPPSTLMRLVQGVTGGAGMAYAVEQKHPGHLPLAFLFPVTYASYHVFRAARTVPYESFELWARPVVQPHPTNPTTSRQQIR